MLYGARGASLMLFNPNEESLIASSTFGLSEATDPRGRSAPAKAWEKRSMERR